MTGSQTGLRCLVGESRRIHLLGVILKNCFCFLLSAIWLPFLCSQIKVLLTGAPVAFLLNIFTSISFRCTNELIFHRWSHDMLKLTTTWLQSSYFCSSAALLPWRILQEITLLEMSQNKGFFSLNRYKLIEPSKTSWYVEKSENTYHRERLGEMEKALAVCWEAPS